MNFQTTIMVEIELPITADIEKGYPATRYEPGEPATVSIDYTPEEAVKAIEAAIKKDDTIEDSIMDGAAAEYAAAEEYYFDMQREEMVLEGLI